MAWASAPTLDTVAERAGVSRQTVSNALHRPERLRSATRDRVFAAIAELGYRPSIPARQLATRRAKAIAVAAHRPQPDGVSGLLLDAFLHGLADACRSSGHQVILYSTSADDRDEIGPIEDLLLTGSADAVVLTATHTGDQRSMWLAQRRAPFCSFGRPWDTSPEGPEYWHDWVDVDGANGCEQAVEYLAARGCRSIAFLGWPAGSGVGDDRRSGWHRAAATLGVLAPIAPMACEDRSDAAEAAVRLAFEGDQAPDGLVCASDTLALGAWRATQHSPRPPRIVGFDATPVTAALGLASIGQPVAQAARTCMDLLLPRLAGGVAPFRGVLLRPSLVDPGRGPTVT